MKLNFMKMRNVSLATSWNKILVIYIFLFQVTTNGYVDYHSKLHLGFPVFAGKVEGTGILEWVLLIFLSAYKGIKETKFW